MGQPDLDQLAINTIRFLAADAVQQANSGHPGLPMGAAPMAYVLWTRHLKHSPAGPRWADRDRFVLSAGHGSMLLYALLFLTGYDLSLDDLRTFRQWGSRTPGHPEHDHTPGVEATTGPLGQGISNAVGLAIAEAHLSGALRPPGPRDRRPSHLRDCQRRRLDGGRRVGSLLARRPPRARQTDRSLRPESHLALWLDVALLHRGRRRPVPGVRLARAARHRRQRPRPPSTRRSRAARAARTQPSIILVRTVIGYGAPHKQNTFEAHGVTARPRRAARREGQSRLAARAGVPGARRRSRRTSGPRWRAGRRSSATGTHGCARIARRIPTWPPSSPDASRGELPDGWDAGLPALRGRRQGHRDPQGVGERDAGDGRRGSRSWSAARRT